MNYKDFDKLVGRASANQIMLFLETEAYTIDDLASKTNLDRTSVFYHLKNLILKGDVEKKMVGKKAVYGLITEKRLKPKHNKIQITDLKIH